VNDSISVIATKAAPQGSGLSGFAASSQPLAPEPAIPPPAAVEAAPDEGSLEDVVHALREQATAAGAELEFSIDEELGRVIVTLRDMRDGSVLRQIPQEEVLRIARLLRQKPAPLVQAVV
jgi:flagellar protein FlaG